MSAELACLRSLGWNGALYYALERVCDRRTLMPPIAGSQYLERVVVVVVVIIVVYVPFCTPVARPPSTEERWHTAERWHCERWRIPTIIDGQLRACSRLCPDSQAHIVVDYHRPPFVIVALYTTAKLAHHYLYFCLSMYPSIYRLLLLRSESSVKAVAALHSHLLSVPSTLPSSSLLGRRYCSLLFQIMFCDSV